MKAIRPDIWIFWFAVVITAGFSGSAFSQTDEPSFLRISPGRQLDFADQYFEAGDFGRSIAEYQRFLFFFPHDENALEVRYRLGRAFFNHQDYAGALEVFKSITQTEPASKLAFAAYFDISDCYRRMEDDQNAMAVLEHAVQLTTDPEIKDHANYRIGWILLENRQWESSESYFNRVSDTGKKRYRTSELTEAIAQVDRIPSKSPRLAGALSILPGAGYLYCGRPKDALFSFLLNGGLIWAAVEAFSNDSPALGSVISLIEAGFYTGNIYGGVNCAHKYNERQTQEFIDRLKQNAALRLSVNPSHPNFRVSLVIPF